MEELASVTQDLQLATRSPTKFQQLAERLGLSRVPVPHTAAGTLISALWTVQAAATPPSFLRYLRYICVADGTRAAQVMGFRPMYSTREALSDYIGAQRLRDAQLLSDPPA